MERRFTNHNADIKIETRDDGTAIISGYSAVFYREGDAGTEYEIWEGMKERVMHGAFDQALAERQDVMGLFNHDMSLILGRTSSGTMKLSVDNIGLRYEIEADDTNIANDVRKHIKRGDINGSSFAFLPTDERWVTTDTAEIRELHSVRLFDSGPVSLPAYKGTTTSVRSVEEDATEAKASYDKMKAEANETTEADELEKNKRMQRVRVQSIKL